MKTLGMILLIILVATGLIFLISWLTMLTIGAASIASAGVVPSLNFWTMFWIVLTVMLLLGPRAKG